jgi:hypothetical protein
MTPEEAAMILEVSPGSGRVRIDEAYSAHCRPYLVRVQHATQPEEREIAKRALGLLQDAYYVLTGQRPPDCLVPSCRRGSSSAEMAPRVALIPGAQRRPSCVPATPNFGRTPELNRSPKPAQGIPRTQLGTNYSARVTPPARPLATGNRAPAPTPANGFQAKAGTPATWREKLTGLLIFLAICVLALVVLGAGVRCGR